MLDNGVFLGNICFLADTLVKTDQGLIPIQKINPDVNTIENKKIIAITETISIDSYLISIERNSLSHNIPNKKTIISPLHRVLYNNQMLQAIELIDRVPGIEKIKYEGDILYNVLLENYDTMNVNNMRVETLHPCNAVGLLYTFFIRNNFTKEEKHKFIKKYNDKYLDCLEKRKVNKL
jgi:hypothetical protein